MNFERLRLRPFVLFLVAWNACLLGTAPSLRGSSQLPVSEWEHLGMADAVLVGEVIGSDCAQDESTGAIFTRTLVRVTQPIAGDLPPVIRLRHRGGQVGNRIDDNGFSPRLKRGGEYLFFLADDGGNAFSACRGTLSAIEIRRDRGRMDLVSRARVGRLTGGVDAGRHPFPARRFPSHAAGPEEIAAVLAATEASEALEVSEAGEAEETAQAVTASGLLVNAFGIPARFTTADRAEPIPYIVDMQALPTGVTAGQALQAVADALAAWSAVTSLTFVFEGTENFGVAAPNVNIDDGKIRIQMHDLFGFINSPTTLGVGGSSTTNGGIPTGGAGAKVNGLECNFKLRGHVVLEHGQAALQDVLTLAEVLCHEIGHVIGLAHSSETDPEPDATLGEAMMYFRAHTDGRGATLGAYDPPIVQKLHPQGNTPPYAFPRVMDVVTAPGMAPNVPGTNAIELKGYDLQSGPGGLTIALSDESLFGAGTFSLNGSTLTFTPAAAFEAPPLDPATNDFYEKITARFDDGTHCSPLVSVRVMSLLRDDFPGGGGDGIPDDWMMAHFGAEAPGLPGSGSHALDDPDGDGLTNLDEFRCDTDPHDGASRPDVRVFNGHAGKFEWDARPFHLYEVESSAGLVTWGFLRAVLPMTATGSTGVPPTGGGGAGFFRIRKVP